MEQSLSAVLAGLQGTDTGAGLLQSIFALQAAPPDAAGIPRDPTGETPDANFTTLVWFSGTPPTTMHLSTWSRLLGGWRTVTYS